MGLILGYVKGTRAWMESVNSIAKSELLHQAKELINKEVKILPTAETNPQDVRSIVVKDIASGDSFYGKPLFVIITDSGARVPVFSHNEIVSVSSI
jgi:hypothetical protein